MLSTQKSRQHQLRTINPNTTNNLKSLNVNAAFFVSTTAAAAKIALAQGPYWIDLRKVACSY
jgi:hypothetical protein